MVFDWLHDLRQELSNAGCRSRHRERFTRRRTVQRKCEGESLECRVLPAVVGVDLSSLNGTTGEADIVFGGNFTGGAEAQVGTDAADTLTANQGASTIVHSDRRSRR